MTIPKIGRLLVPAAGRARFASRMKETGAQAVEDFEFPSGRLNKTRMNDLPIGTVRTEHDRGMQGDDFRVLAGHHSSAGFVKFVHVCGSYHMRLASTSGS